MTAPRPPASCLPLAPLRRRVALPAASMACALLLSACMEFPDLDARLTEADRNAPSPFLVPAETILAGSDTVAIAPETQTALEDRIAALERRAEGLRATGFDPATRERMQSGVSQPQPRP